MCKQNTFVLHGNAAPAALLRATRRCGTRGYIIVVGIVVIDVAVVVHDADIVIVILVRRTEPPPHGVSNFQPYPLYDTALRHISKSFTVAFHPSSEKILAIVYLFRYLLILLLCNTPLLH